MDYMTYIYRSPLGNMLITADKEGLASLQFAENRNSLSDTAGNDLICSEDVIPYDGILSRTVAWLDEYFAGDVPDFIPPLKFETTDFRRRVLDYLLTIPYGSVVSYSCIARQLHSSPRAVGGAVAHNPIAIIIPCHRVLGSNGDITGYAWGLERKRALLSLEASQIRIRGGNRVASALYTSQD